MPGMKEFMDRVAGLIAQRQQRRAIADVSRRIVPDHLQEQILQACEAERAAVLARMDQIDRDLETLEGRRLEALQAKRATFRPIASPARTVRQLDGRTRQIPERIRAYESTPATAAAHQVLKRITDHMAALRQERAHRLSELGVIRSIEDQTAAGVTTGLLAITARWRNRIDVGQLLPKVKLARSYSDAAGNPLPPEALDADGAPTISLEGQAVHRG